MPIGNFTVGRDISLSIVTSSGPLQLNLITAFRSKQEIIEIKVKGLDGVTRFVRFVDGWTGSFQIERRDPTVDSYFSQLEANYFAGQSERPVSITETVTEIDGSVSQFRYKEVYLKLDDAGEYKGDSTVKQSISFVARERPQIS